MRRIWLLAILSALALAQSRQSKPAFDVASVKVAASNVSAPSSRDLRQVRYTGVRLKSVLQDAYNVKRYQISGPDWLETQHYDIVARLPEDASQEQIPAMLQTLLAERFHMKVHTELRQDRIYALIVAKSGPHLNPAAGRPVGMEFHDGRIEFTSATLDAFASVLSGYLDYPVLDMTGIQGRFDIILAPEGGPPNTIPDTNFSSAIVSAVGELGLKLETRIAPVEHVVVDSGDKIPTEN
jgi:uncharacterized protein (TIGR03435 family)